MKKRTLQCLLLGSLMSLATVASAQTLLINCEAENYVLNGRTGGGGSEPKIVTNSNFSGGIAVAGISQSNFVLYNFYVENEDTYNLKIYYSYTEDQSSTQGGYLTTRINNQERSTVGSKLTTQGTNPGDVIQEYDVLVYCEKGWNTLRIGRNVNVIPSGVPSHYTPYIDKWELYTTASSITKPADETDASELTELSTVASFAKSQYSWDLTEEAKGITLVTGSTTSNVAFLTDNDLSTVFTSDDNEVVLELEYENAVVVKHLVMNDVLKLGTYKLEYYNEGTSNWDLLDKKPAYCLFTNGALWYDTQAGDKAAYTKYRLTLYKAPGAPQIEVADILLVGWYYTKDITNGINTYPYMADDLKTEAEVTTEGRFVYTSSPAETYNGITGWGTLDNARGTKYSVESKTLKLVYEFDKTAKVNSFVLANATTRGRDARTFEILGSNDTDPQNFTAYTSLYSISDLDWKGNAYMFGGKINAPAYYKYYMLDVTANNGDGSRVEIGDLLFFGEIYNIPSSIEDDNALALNIYNTANGIAISGANDTADYQVTDMFGKVVKEGKLSVQDVTVSLAKGIYIVRVNDGKSNVLVKKVIVK